MKGLFLRKKVLKAGDFFLLGFGVLFVTFLFARFLFSAPAGRQAAVTAGSETKLYDLGTDRTVYAEGPLGRTEVVIGSGEIWVRDSPCRDKVCVRMGKKKRAGEQIICIPNRVVVEVKGDSVDFDAISR